MADTSPSIRAVLDVPDKDAHESDPSRWHKFRTRVSDEVKGIKWVALPALTERVCELLEIKISDVFLASWKKMDELKKALDESEKNPKTTKYLGLAEHTIRSEHKPYIEARIEGLPAKKLEFLVKLSLTLKGFVLKVEKGDIVEIQTGRCEAEGKVSYKELTLVEKKLEPILLPGSIKCANPDKPGSG